MISWASKNSYRLMLSLILLWILGGVGLEFYNIAWGTGVWWGEFAFTWAVLFLGFLLTCIGVFTAANYLIWRSDLFSAMELRVVQVRNKFGSFRWVLGLILVTLPIWLLQYTAWGVIFHGIFFRAAVWAVMVLSISIMLTKDNLLIGWKQLLAALILSAGLFSVAASLTNVTDHPFSLGWSEGNRMWDYSLMFGRDIYNYPTDRPPAAYLDFGRQLSGGLPFLFPHLTILEERLWLALMTVIPYVLLGWISFRLSRSESKLFPFLGGLWAWMFLSQGPIHAPLLWCAILVAIAWRKPLWFAIPLVFMAAYIATVSRSTWVFAPAMWAGILELSSVSFRQFRINLKIWGRAIAVVLAGLAGGPFYSTAVSLGSWLKTFFKHDAVSGGVPSISPGSVTISSVTSAVTDQPLLWYRLLPNATYGNGILLGLAIAVMPVAIVLVYHYVSARWVLHIWQKLVLIFSLLAFLVVGLVVSAKIGGGGDLHNMDMFLIGMMFSAALAWRAGGHHWIGVVERYPKWLWLVVLLLIALPAFKPLMSLRPISSAGKAEWLATLSDAKTPRAMGLLPSDKSTESALEMIRGYVQEAQTHGEVLFMDQRQLLTFGYIQDVMLVAEYEKKAMMDRALSSDAAYFEPFYRDLAAHRFSLIISDPLGTPIKDSDYQFGEENNAWVEWVARPTLCYYAPVETQPELRLQLLVPKENTSDCSQILP